MQRVLHRKLFLVIAIALGFPGMLLAQSGTGTLDGVVTDPSGAVVPGVDITITNIGTGATQVVVTTESGVYRAPFLPPGTYRVSAALPQPRQQRPSSGEEGSLSRKNAQRTQE